MQRYRSPAIYIITNRKHGILYSGVSADLAPRIYEHKNKIYKGFSYKYNCDKLVYYESYDTMGQAIDREKQIKKFNRAKKIKLIEGMNPEWRDLYEDITW